MVQRIWSGGRNLTAVPHFDYPANFYVQVFGKKTWVLFDLRAMWSLHMCPAASPSWRHGQVDVTQWEDIKEEYPLVEGLKRIGGQVVRYIRASCGLGDGDAE